MSLLNSYDAARPAANSARSRVALLLLALTAATSDAQPATGFTPLFDGSLGEATVENGGGFTIESGVLRAEGPEGWLRFPGFFRTFRLRIELRFLTDNADSGVFFRTVPDGEFARGWPNRSYQVQLLNPAAGGALPPVGGLFRHGMPPGDTQFDPEAVRAAFTGTGEWQLLEITVAGPELAVQLNGVPVTKASALSDVAGYIGIQSETSAVEFRRIDIEGVDERALAQQMGDQVYRRWTPLSDDTIGDLEIDRDQIRWASDAPFSYEVISQFADTLTVRPAVDASYKGHACCGQLISFQVVFEGGEPTKLRARLYAVLADGSRRHNATTYYRPMR